MTAIWPISALMAAAVACATWFATRQVLGYLRRQEIFDRPNERSSHDTPVPRGGGLAVIGVLVPALVFAGVLLGAPETWYVAAALAGLAGISWIDDIKGLPAGPRLIAQAGAVALGLLALPGPIAQGLLAPWLDTAFAALAWLWFINLFNFMDGIDGIAGSEATALAIGIVLVAALPGGPDDLVLYAAAIGGAALGFLPWNWHRAKIFLGDVGSVPLGFALGWLLLGLAASGAWIAALVLPLYYLADSTLTLARRAVRGELVWRAHREHFYQRAVQGGMSHDKVVRAIGAGNLALVGLAVAGEASLGWSVLPMAAGVVAVVLWRLSLGRP